ncbi:MAG: recombinase family protein [Clostridia bacterium]|nr:recombinase family protein [Clostridia bacterium]
MDIYTIKEQMTRYGKRLSDIPLRVVYYARVSTEKDAQLHSLASQKAYFQKMVEDNVNWTLVCGYVDEGISATSVKNREEFLKMIQDAKLRKFDLILTKEISRFARNTLDSLTYTQELLKNGVGVFFVNDNLNTLEPDGELRLIIMSGMAQDESRKVSERVSFGFKRSIEKGVVLGNDSIWGYQKDNGKLVIVPKEAEMVKKIFEFYANCDMGIRQIAKAISELGYKNTNGKEFSFSTIRGILKNPKYKGYYCGNKTHKLDFRHDDIKYLPEEDWILYEDNFTVPPIVSVRLWDKANHKLKERSEKMSSNDKTSYQNKYLYSGKIICGEHGTCYYHTVYKYKSGNKELWTCKEYGNGNKCRNPLVYKEEIDAVLEEIYKGVLLDKHGIINELIEVYKGNRLDIKKSMYKIEKEISAIYAKKEKLLDLVMDSRITNEEFEQRNNALNSQLDQLDKRKKDLESEEKINIAQIDRNRELEEHISKELCFSDNMSKNLIDSFLDKIIVCQGREETEIELKIRLYLPYENTTGTILKTRGANSKKARDLKINYSII